MRPARCLRLSLSVLTLCASISAPVLAADPAYYTVQDESRLPACTASSVQSAVAGTVARARKDYYDGRTIVGIDQIQQVRYEADGVSPLARRYCRGKASLSDGSYQSVHYMVEENAGFVGVSWNVEACLAPLDKWRVYGAYCSTTRPH